MDALIEATIDSGAAFLIIAGDVFDGDWKDVTTGLFFARALGRLHRAGVPTILVKGNHDAESLMSRALAYPESVRILPSSRADTLCFDALHVAVHGRSFGSRKVPDDFVASYPARREGWFNIGILHTGLDGARGHESYAPCTVEDLRRFGYDYWALGHVHAAEIVCRDPWIVYPGNTQGRSIRETGPKGAMRVTVEDGRVVDATPLFLDQARWANEIIDASGCEGFADALALVGESLARLHGAADGRPLAVRLTLSGTTSAHLELVARQEAIEDEARALGFGIAEDCWIEQVKLRTSAPPRPVAVPAEPDALDLDALLAASADDPDYAQAVSELIAGIAEKLPRELRQEITGDGKESLARRIALARDYLAGGLGGELSA